jgi:hypothetical protein
MWWIVILAIALPIVLFLLASVLGFVMKPETTGKALLKKKIKQRGIDPKQIPELVLQDITEGAIRVAEMRKSLGDAHFNTALVEHIDGSVELLKMYLRDDLNEFDLKSSLIQKMQQTMPHLRGSIKS